MKTTWTKGVDKDRLDEIKKSFSSSLLIRKRQVEVLDAKISEAYRVARSKEGYESPNWAYQQADLCGYVRALEEVKSLLK